MKKISFKLFEFKGGKFTTLPDISSKKLKGFILSSIILLIVVSLSGWLKIDEKELWKLYNLIIQQFGLTQDIPRIENEKEIDARIELEVDKAIKKVTPEYDRIIFEADQKYRPKYLEKPVNPELQTGESALLGGEMRICAPWVEDCN